MRARRPQAAHNPHALAPGNPPSATLISRSPPPDPPFWMARLVPSLHARTTHIDNVTPRARTDDRDDECPDNWKGSSSFAA